MGQEFVLQKGYEVIKGLGKGSYGVVCSAKNIENDDNNKVAIKKITNIFSKKMVAKRALREIMLLQHFRNHKNITMLYDMDIVDPSKFNELYLYEELMQANLNSIIKSDQPLTDAHFQSFIYQILCGLKYIHSANVLHRDLKPSNLLINADCKLKICDFGLSRGMSVNQGQGTEYMTEYVTTRWYRAPEVMLSFQSYSKAIDLWSVGCILAELLGRKPFFKGSNYVDQLNQIFCILGTPNENIISKIKSASAQNYIRSLPTIPKMPYSKIFPYANPDALDLLNCLLTFDPCDRISCEEALEHPYLIIWHDPKKEPVCSEQFDFGFEAIDSIEEIKQMIIDEVLRFKGLTRNQNLYHSISHT
ncbi:mitogen-activated protein kinase 1 [Pneumocystis carinii B80]|uniref:Mitogen-activated protein kinase n=1 Tax=Pneumocystis carinii (strain B80) TaxID=1408658 RepID=A0A0W4ZIE7_PNEC8|nr:mitogen-activated protein kinase 1 [Pneumocystis carinii B80]KTW28136.1 mitogen-activated protein kinase 1 [Pneumocystis carinii B80]